MLLYNMPKPIVINIAMLVRNKNGTYALDLLQDDGTTDRTHRFELTPEAYEQLRADTEQPPFAGLEGAFLEEAFKEIGPIGSRIELVQGILGVYALDKTIPDEPCPACEMRGHDLANCPLNPES